MICVCIGRGRHRHLLAEHQHLVDKGAKLVELRLDYINGEINLKRILPERPGPVVVSIRREIDGGKWHGSEEERQMLLRAAIVDGVEYIDLEEDVANQIPRYGKTKRIVSYHNFRKTPDDLPALHARLAALDADVVKLSTMANSPHDALRMLRLSQTAKVPTVALCMGDLGTPSRILGGRYGSPFTYASFHHERLLAPGQLSFEQMTEIYHYEQINRETKLFGVIADPIGHSLSPLVHNAALHQSGLNAAYIPFRVPPEHLEQFLTDARELGIGGLSVTIPHKEAVLRKVTKLDPAVKGIGAANTLVFDGDELLGYNTDYRAAIDSLERAMQSPDYQRGGLKDKTALILGAGGAARAIAYGLRREGTKVIISGRTPKRADALADAFDCSTIDWNNRHGISPDILINCTPVGMHPNVDDTPYDKRHLRPAMVVFDTVYNPQNTLLIKEARSQSCTVVTGLEMFVRQASLQFKLFTGEDAPWEHIRDTLKRAIGPART